MVELIVVIVVLAILGSVAIVSYRRTTANAQDEAALASLESVAREAEALAVLEDRSVSIADVEAAAADLPDAAASPGMAAAAWTVQAQGTDPCEVGGIAATGLILFSADGAEFRVTTLSPTGNIVFVVAGTVDGRGIGCAAPDAPTNAPGAPTGLNITVGSEQLALSWTKATNTATYTIERTAASPVAWAQVGTTHLTQFVDPVANGVTYIYRIRATNVAGTSAPSNTVQATAVAPSPYANAVVASAPIAYWRMEESSSTTAADSSGNGYHLSANGSWPSPIGNTASPLTSGGKAFSHTQLRYLAQSTMPQIGDAITVEFWFKGDPTLTGYSPHSSRLIGNTAGFSLQKVPNVNTIYLRVDTSAKMNHTGAMVANAWDNTWHHIAFTLGAGTNRAYLDGVLVATVAYPHGNGFAVNQSFLIGVQGNSAVDEYAMYNRVLSANEIAAHYAAR